MQSRLFPTVTQTGKKCSRSDPVVVEKGLRCGVTRFQFAAPVVQQADQLFHHIVAGIVHNIMSSLHISALDAGDDTGDVVVEPDMQVIDDFVRSPVLRRDGIDRLVEPLAEVAEIMAAGSRRRNLGAARSQSVARRCFQTSCAPIACSRSSTDIALGIGGLVPGFAKQSPRKGMKVRSQTSDIGVC